MERRQANPATSGLSERRQVQLLSIHPVSTHPWLMVQAGKAKHGQAFFVAASVSPTPNSNCCVAPGASGTNVWVREGYGWVTSQLSLPFLPCLRLILRFKNKYP